MQFSLYRMSFVICVTTLAAIQCEKALRAQIYLDFPQNNRDRVKQSITVKYRDVYFGPEFSTLSVIRSGGSSIVPFLKDAGRFLEKTGASVTQKAIGDLLGGEKIGDLVGGIAAVNNWKFVNGPKIEFRGVSSRIGVRKIKIAGPNSFIPWIAYTRQDAAPSGGSVDLERDLLSGWISLELQGRSVFVDHDRILRAARLPSSDYRTCFEVVRSSQNPSQYALRSFEGLFVTVADDPSGSSAIANRVDIGGPAELFTVEKFGSSTFSFRTVHSSRKYLSNEGGSVTVDRKEPLQLERFVVHERIGPPNYLTSRFFIKTPGGEYLSTQYPGDPDEELAIVVTVAKPKQNEIWTAITIGENVVAIRSDLPQPRFKRFLTTADVPERVKDHPESTLLANRISIGEGEQWIIEPVEGKSQTYYFKSLDRNQYLRVENGVVTADKDSPPGRLETFEIVKAD